LLKDSLIIVVLLTFGGLFAGLTIGYISMDHLELELKAKNGTDVNHIIKYIRKKKKQLPLYCQL
jgi:hypothetical protein